MASLHQEKEIHKQHRHAHVVQKLTLSSSLFGLGQLFGQNTVMHLFLYVVPFFTIAHDLYIMAEDFKVKRIGFYIRYLARCPLGAPNLICAEEAYWENTWLPANRETWGCIASMIYTAIIILLSSYLTYVLDVAGNPARLMPYAIWLGACIAGMVVVVVVSFHIRIAVYRRNEAANAD